MIRWAQEVWAATAPFAGVHFSVKQLREFWENFHWAGVTAWRHVAGPLGALKFSAERIGWTIRSPFDWLDDRGIELPLADMSPAMLKWHIRQSSERFIERSIADSFDHVEYSGRRANLRIVRSVLRAKRHEHALSHNEKASLVAAASNAVWTNKRLHIA